MLKSRIFVTLLCLILILGNCLWSEAKTKAVKLKISPKSQLYVPNKLTYNNFKSVTGYVPAYFPEFLPETNKKYRGKQHRVNILRFCQQKNLEFNTLDAKNYIVNNRIQIIDFEVGGKCFNLVVNRYGY